jgi:hypothetical protein
MLVTIGTPVASDGVAYILLARWITSIFSFRKAIFVLALASSSISHSMPTHRILPLQI